MIRALGWCASIIGASALVFTGFALIEQQADLASRFLLTSLIGLFCGGMVLLGTQALTQPAGPAAALRLALLSWLIMPLLAAPPLLIEGALVVDAIFEAYSAMTTTGAVVHAPESLPRSLVLWRSYLAWLGGLASLVLAATLFAALDRRGVGLRRTSLLTVERSDLFANFGRALRRLGVVYAGLTALGAVALIITGTAPFQALNLSMSALSTSGLSAQSGALFDILTPASIVVLAAMCLTGAWNFAVMVDIAARQRIQRGTGEMRAIIAISIAIGLFVLIISMGSAQLAAITVLDSLFALTTAGFSTHSAYAPPVAVLLFLALIGGATISTSGGIKMPRVLVLLRRAGGEISLLSHPSAAVQTRYGGRSVQSEALTGVWVYTLAYPMALGVGAALVALMGTQFHDAWTIAAASLSNAGPLAQSAFDNATSGTKLVSIVLMLAGRMEILAAAAAIFVMFADD